MSAFKVLLLVALVATLAATQAEATPLMPTVCSAQEEASMPCVCCKKSCWFGITEMTTAYFGHMPGERSDAEAKFTLAMMKQCFKIECADTCPTAAQ